MEVLRIPLESDQSIKIIHNAAFVATRLLDHYKFKTAPVYDTMLAARRNGEKKYSLQAQAFTHLNLRLDKQMQRSDWSRRPLDLKQINYAAVDAYAAFRLYRHQTERNLNGWYRLKGLPSPSLQGQLPLDNSPELADLPAEPDFLPAAKSNAMRETTPIIAELSASLIALLGITSELPTRYSPDALAVSVGIDRVGLAGWIVDRTLGRDADFDEESARLAIAELIERQLIKLTETRRLEATEEGTRLWQKVKQR